MTARTLLLASVLALAPAPGASGAADRPDDVWFVRGADGRVLDARDPDRALNPASVVKIATAWWALATLGPEHRFETRFGLRGERPPVDGVFAGDLVVVGGGDPDFHPENVWLVAEALHRLGVREVRGDLVVTTGFWLGWEGGGPYPDAGLRAEAMARRLNGVLDPRHWSSSTRRSLAEFAERSGRDLAAFPGVRTRGRVRGLTGNAHALGALDALDALDGAAAVVHRSNPLPVLLKRFNSYSNNDIERLGWTLGDATALSAFVRERLGIPDGEIAIDSLSGLGTGRMSCRAIVEMVDGFATFLERGRLRLSDLLPANGCDPGTLRAYRRLERRDPAALVAKTGTLITTDDGVSVMAGVLQGVDGAATFCRAALASGDRTVDARHDTESWLLAALGDATPTPVPACGAAVVSPDADARVVTHAGEPPPRPGADWPGYLGADGDAVADGAEFPRAFLSRTPPVAWTVKAGEGYAAPSVVGERVYFFDRVGDEARLRALRATDGSTVWERRYATDYEDLYQFSGGPRASPVVAGERVCTFGAEGRLRCHATHDGRLLWDVGTREAFGVVQNFFGVGSTPVVADDTLIVQVGGSPPDSPDVHSGETRPAGSGVVAFDLATGEVRWKAGDTLASYSSPMIATIAGRSRGLLLAREGLLAFDPASGAVDFLLPWRAKRLQSVNAANPVVVGDEVLISEAYGPGSALVRLGDGSPEVVWRTARRDAALLSHWATPAHRDGVLYGVHGYGSSSIDLRAVDWASGEVLWASPPIERATLLLVGDTLIVPLEGGEVRIVDATREAYRPRTTWTFADEAGRPLLRRPVWNAPVLARGQLYLRGKDRLVAIDLRHGDGS